MWQAIADHISAEAATEDFQISHKQQLPHPFRQSAVPDSRAITIEHPASSTGPTPAIFCQTQPAGSAGQFRHRGIEFASHKPASLPEDTTGDLPRPNAG